MRKRQIALILLLVAVVFTGACGKKKSSAKNMEQLRAEQGIPVRERVLEPETFVQELTYNAPLAGMEESTAQAMVGDIVIKVNAKIGDRVTKGQIIMSFPQNTPAAQYEQASTAVAAQKQVYDRMKRLFDQGAISQQDLDNVETGYKVSKANLEASEQMINVRAPISGIITAIMVQPSEKVFPGKDLFTVATSNGYKAVLMVPDTEVHKLRIGTAAKAQIGDIVLTGRVSQISMAVDQQSKAVRVEAVFPGMNKAVSYGSTARVMLNVTSKPNCIVVAREHIVFENGSAYVWVSENGRAQKREVTTGIDDQLRYEILTGLASGDKLITEGINLLSENSMIRVID